MVGTQDYETTAGTYHPVFDQIYLPFTMFRVIRGSAIATSAVSEREAAKAIGEIAVRKNN